MKGVVFLDRDGVINQDSPDYIKTPDEFHFIPGSPEAIARLTRAGLAVMVITNQSLIGRKMADTETLAAIFDKMKKGVNAAGGKIRDIFYCPHLPSAGCECRKPEPGLIFQARDRYAIDLQRSVMVGDSAKDIEAGLNAGCGHTVLVRTGNGALALEILAGKQIQPDHVATDLSAAANWITTRLFLS